MGGIMSKNGPVLTVILNLLIVLLLAGLIAVILIPGKIWDQEARDKQRSQDNMSSIYEAERYYHLITDDYTTDPGELLSLVHGDSALLIRQQVVNYTRALVAHIDGYFKITLIKTLSEINQNFANIVDDLDANEIYLKVDPDILSESKSLIVDMSGAYANGFTELRTTLHMLDSLSQLRRDFSDYSLQTDAAKSLALTDTINTLLNAIDMNAVFDIWQPLSQRLDAFSKKVNRSVIKENTSVADRVKNFRQKIDGAFKEMKKGNKEKDISKAQDINAAIASLYNEFLKKFIITSKKALYALSLEDSLIISLTQDDFYSPVELVPGEKHAYKILIDEDSSAVKVESPILLEDLREKTMPAVDLIKSLSFLPNYKAYFDSLDSILKKSAEIKTKLKRNPDIFFKHKEIEALINKYSDISLYSAYSDLNKLAQETPKTESYSDLKTDIESALSGARLFKQAYQDNFFGNLDSLHLDLKKALQQYDEIMSKVRRLPRGITKFEEDIASLDMALEQAKNPGSKDEISTTLNSLESVLADAFIFAEEGKSIPAYGIFSRKIENFGYIYKDSKSWEE
jgi:hypothetical protein